ncbi:MAG: hypothetical protein ACRD6R_14000, partial [Candidatus Polarisedimenticolia bacterium]
AEGVRQAEQAIAAASPLLQRDILFQARALLAAAFRAAGRTPEAAEAAAAGLEPLAEMRDGLPLEILPLFLGRPATRAFAAEAERLFRGAGRAAEAERLDVLLRPTGGAPASGAAPPGAAASEKD